MPSIHAHIANWYSKRYNKKALGDLSNLDQIRKIFNTKLPYPSGCDFTPDVLDNVPGEWIIDNSLTKYKGILLYIHGGGFVGCSPQTHRPITASLALKGWKVFAVDYRLSPEHAFPIPLYDAITAWRYLTANYQDQRLVVAGDSAGGNLTLALINHEKTHNQKLPDSIALLSPSTDMTAQSRSLLSNSDKDSLFQGIYLERFSEYYLQGQDTDNPLVSPILADLTDYPPMVIHVGQDEVLRDDALRLAKKARESGVLVSIQMWPVVPHVWQLQYKMLEAQQSLQQIDQFLQHSEPLGENNVEYLDIVVVGAGLSGIGSAREILKKCPYSNIAILESRDNIGGTWDFFKFPGLRADADRFLMSYQSAPNLSSKRHASGSEMLDYLKQTAENDGIDYLIRYNHKLLSANWNSLIDCWELRVQTAQGIQNLHCRILNACSGYYNYDQAHNPVFPGQEIFQGPIVHTQFWPEYLDYKDKKIVIVGSGATAITLAPKLAETAQKVTILQRSPSYIISTSKEEVIYKLIKFWPQKLQYKILRIKSFLVTVMFYKYCRTFPNQAAKWISMTAAKTSGSLEHLKDYTPKYKPWDQRLCITPDGDFFKAVYDEKVFLITDTIDAVHHDGILLESGEFVESDIIIKATGLELLPLGGIKVSVDNQIIDVKSKFIYKGCMLDNVPNFVFVRGSANLPWTLRCDMSNQYVVRVIDYMSRNNLNVFMPITPIGLNTREPSILNSGYILRNKDKLPQQSTKWPWRIFEENYAKEWLLMKFGKLVDGVLNFR